MATPRYKHISAAIGLRLFLWGGWIEKMPLYKSGLEAVRHDKNDELTYASTVDVLDITNGEWSNGTTKGIPHPGVIGAASVVIGRKIIVFGGYCGHDACFYNTISELDTDKMEWKEISAQDDKAAHRKRAACGMVTFKNKKGEDVLCIIGGEGPWPHTSLAMAADVDYSDMNRSATKENDIQCFNLTTRQWFTPTVHGSKPPPCSYHSLVSVNANEALLIGGFSKNQTSSETYTLSFHSGVTGDNSETGTFLWSAPIIYKDVKQRNGHTCTNIGDSRTILIGGEDYIDHSLDELWLLELQKSSQTFEKRKIESAGVAERSYHTTTLIEIQGQSWLIISGGISHWKSADKAWKQDIRSDHAFILLEEKHGKLDMVHYNIKSFMGQVRSSISSQTSFSRTYSSSSQHSIKEFEVQCHGLLVLTNSHHSATIVSLGSGSTVKLDAKFEVVSDIFHLKSAAGKGSGASDAVTVKVPHCALAKDNEDVSEHLKFMISTSTTPPYDFKAYGGEYTFTAVETMQYCEAILNPGLTADAKGVLIAVCGEVSLSTNYPSGEIILTASYGKAYHTALYVNETDQYETKACLAVCKDLEGKKETLKQNFQKYQSNWEEQHNQRIQATPKLKDLEVLVTNEDTCWTTNPSKIDKLCLNDVEKFSDYTDKSYPLQFISCCNSEQTELPASGSACIRLSLQGGLLKEDYKLHPKCKFKPPNKIIFSSWLWKFFLSSVIVAILFQIIMRSSAWSTVTTNCGFNTEDTYSPADDKDIKFAVESFASEAELMNDDFINSITHSKLFCVALYGDVNECKGIEKEYSNDPIRVKVIEILKVWYDKKQSLKKKHIYDALYRHVDHRGAAKKFAKRHS